MFEDFRRERIDVGDAAINLVIGGSGPAVLLLHGYPQTHVMWHKLAPRLAESFTVVAADLRGYGDSSKPLANPPGGPDHAGYAKRAMALDQVRVMDHLGIDRFAVVGHDRGGRVAHRLALDHAARVTRLAVLDICPTLDMYEATNKTFATAYYHWFFLIQPYDLPERLIGANPAYYLRKKLGHWGRDAQAFTAEALNEYIRCFSNPETIHATCEDYRAAASIDLVHDRADRDRKLSCPVLALWGAKGFVGRHYDVLAVWRTRAAQVSGRAVASGHFLPEEAPKETLREIAAFLS
ncbi:MAG: alpha/beta hydrolase [Alphaproteobacteria bacterium]|nr:alpha/beta hydrolase [Alphaproteobacteria bacterium]